MSAAPRWLFRRLAVLVTRLPWLPDRCDLDLGQPARAVTVLIGDRDRCAGASA
jgi:hypothetical protein